MLVFLWKKNTQVLSVTASLVLAYFPFCFVLKSLLSLLFTSHYGMEAFLNYLFDSSVFAKHSVIY